MRKRHIQTAIIFLLSLLILSICLEKVFDYFIRQNFHIKTSVIANGHIDADILLQGSSRSLYNVDPVVIKEQLHKTSYNTSLNSISIFETTALLQLYLEHNKKPALICTEITATGLSKGRIGFGGWYFTPFLDDANVLAMVKKRDTLLYWLHYLPFMKHALYNSFSTDAFVYGVKQAIKGKDDPTESGFVRTNRQWDGFALELFKRKSPKGRHIAPDKATIAAMRDYIRYVQSQHIKLVFYEAPLLKELLPLFTNRNAMIDTIQNICRQNNVPFICFQGLPIEEHRENFYNATHLSGKMAGYFTGLLCDSLRKRGLVE
jgi:hypothetical protein